MAFKVEQRASSAQLPGQLGLRTPQASDFATGLEAPLSQAGEFIAKRANDNRLRRAKRDARDFQMSLEDSLRGADFQLRQLQGKDARDITSNSKKIWGQEKFQELTKDVKDQDALNAMRPIYDRLVSSHLDGLSKYEVQQDKVHERTSRKNWGARAVSKATDLGINGYGQLKEGIALVNQEFADDDAMRQETWDGMIEGFISQNSASNPEDTELIFKQNFDEIKSLYSGSMDKLGDVIRINKNAKIDAKDKTEAETRRQIKELQNGLEADYIVNADAGNPPSLIAIGNDFRIGNLRQAQYDRILARITNPIEISDKEVFNFIDGILTNDPELIDQDDILEADGLTLADIKELDRRRGLMQDSKFKDDFKSGTDNLDAVIITTGPLSKLRKTAQTERLSNAKTELRERLESKEDLNKILEDMVPRYRTKKVTLKSLPKTRYVDTPATLEQVRSARELLRQKNLAGQIPDTESARREAALLEEYEDILSRKE